MTATKADPFKFTVNVPATLKIRFVDVRPGKLWADPRAGGATKKLPAQVSIKGTFDGVDTIAYLPGPVWKNIKALSDAGVIEPQDTKALEAVEEPTAIQVVHSDVTATLVKNAGDKYEQMQYRPAGMPAAPVSKRVSAADADPYVGVPALPDFPRSQGKPVQRVPVPQRSAPSRGGPLPGEDELPEDVEAWMGGALPESPDDFEAFSRAVDSVAQPAPTPREVENAAYPNEKRTRLRNAYLALWRDVAMFTAAEAKAHGFTVDGASVNATTFSIWGTWKESGLRPS